MGAVATREPSLAIDRSRLERVLEQVGLRPDRLAFAGTPRALLERASLLSIDVDLFDFRIAQLGAARANHGNLESMLRIEASQLRLRLAEIEFDTAGPYAIVEPTADASGNHFAIGGEHGGVAQRYASALVDEAAFSDSLNHHRESIARAIGNQGQSARAA